MGSIQDQLFDEFAAIAVGTAGQEETAEESRGPAPAAEYDDSRASARSTAAEDRGEEPEGGARTSATARATSRPAGGATRSSTASAISTALKTGFGVAPLVAGLIGLFGGGGDRDEAEPLVKYTLPAPLRIERAETDWELSGVDYDQMGMPRIYAGGDAAAAGVQAVTAPRPANPGSVGTAGDRAAGAPQITVNVQAMDARSFMDHSAEIAAAVRNAMLNMSSINDVVNDL